MGAWCGAVLTGEGLTVEGREEQQWWVNNTL